MNTSVNPEVLEIRSQFRKLESNLKKWDAEIENVWREFNGLMRLFHNLNMLEDDSSESPAIRITSKLTQKKKKIENLEKRTKKKSRRIVWNAWVLDSSSESESDTESESESESDEYFSSG